MRGVEPRTPHGREYGREEREADGSIGGLLGELFCLTGGGFAHVHREREVQPLSSGRGARSAFEATDSLRGMAFPCRHDTQSGQVASTRRRPARPASWKTGWSMGSPNGRPRRGRTPPRSRTSFRSQTKWLFCPSGSPPRPPLPRPAPPPGSPAPRTDARARRTGWLLLHRGHRRQRSSRRGGAPPHAPPRRAQRRELPCGPLPLRAGPRRCGCAQCCPEPR